MPEVLQLELELHIVCHLNHFEFHLLKHLVKMGDLSKFRRFEVTKKTCDISSLNEPCLAEFLINLVLTIAPFEPKSLYLSLKLEGQIKVLSLFR